MADADDELHALAARLGMQRRWFQWNERRPYQAHYDVPERLRPDAIRLGAVQITWRQVGRMMRERRNAGRGAAPPAAQPEAGSAAQPAAGSVEVSVAGPR